MVDVSEPGANRDTSRPTGSRRPFFPPSWAEFLRRLGGVADWWDVARRIALNIAIFSAAVLLYLGVTEPVLKLTKLYVLTDEHSLWSVIVALFAKDELFLGTIIFTFSIVFPALKLFYLLVVALAPPMSDRRYIMQWMSWLGKWSMLDVLVLALVIFYAKSNDLADAATLPGVYYFTGSVVLTMIAYGWVKKMPDDA
ncbi:MAG: paraquat-inducible protein A [Pseudomonadota bacterium]